MDYFQQASKARTDRIEAYTQWTSLLKEGGHTTEDICGNIETNTSKQHEVLKERKKINTRLINQDQKIKSLSDNITTRLGHFPSTMPQTIDVGGSEYTNFFPWVEVAKREPKLAPEMVRQKAPAVIVKTGDLSYVEALQKIRKDPSLQAVSKDIMSLRKTEAGHRLVELDKGSCNVDRINSAIKKAVGDTAAVSTLTQTVRLGIFGLDKSSTPEEVDKTFILATGEDPAVKAVMWKIPRGLQMAIIMANIETSRKAAELGRIRVGYTFCRVRMWHESKGCFR